MLNRKWIFRITSLALMGACGWMGYRYGSHSDVNPQYSQVQSDLSVSKPSPQGVTQLQGQNQNSDKILDTTHSSIQTQVSQQASEQYHSLVVAHHLEQKRSEFEKVFSKSEAGQKLVQVSTLLGYGPLVHSPESDFVQTQIQWVRDHPEETLAELKNGISKIDSEYVHEKEFLVQMVGQLDISEQKKLEFFSEELKKTASISDSSQPGARASMGVTVLSSLMRQAKDPSEIEPALRDTLSQLKEDSEKRLLLSTYGNQFSERAQRLSQELGL